MPLTREMIAYRENEKIIAPNLCFYSSGWSMVMEEISNTDGEQNHYRHENKIQFYTRFWPHLTSNALLEIRNSIDHLVPDNVGGRDRIRWLPANTL